MVELEVPLSVFLEGREVVVYVENYLNKPSGDRIEKVCLQFLNEGYRKLILDFRETELVNSIGVSFLLGIIDACERHGSELVLTNLNENVFNLFELLGITKRVKVDFIEDESSTRDLH
ncbi:MAG: STAS domain-containing protein [Pyrinomonadaceae bacterium]|nr:STAS domain-containing protein [Pyrinomonadaceae bacterium]MCX7638962.1 STAS domain-containing protein [Pyrinomonadaceae bacterium]MDW8304901.1 STAS domain-containing protein [Acidobacteriota bacterium]